ncbi:P-loop containing nucleoside triphosphate hydrolase protein [Chytriomyces sp. MP71]|nr:P-loop containing nucleoside triphosphate hydrolase protein [Chytriomyces sp. MP71]
MPPPKKTSAPAAKKGAKDAPPPEKPLFVPEPGQKLTREQHALLRAQRAKAAEDEKKALFGPSWTGLAHSFSLEVFLSLPSTPGKTPVSVLHEHCQRMEWNRVQIDVTKKGNKGFVGTVILSKENPKTRTRMQFSYTDPEFARVYPSEQEAKHWAATYALHRVASHLSLHRLLPPSHQAYWAGLEVIRREESPEVQKWEYAPDPFAVEDLKAKESKFKERETKLEQEKVAKEMERASKPWEIYQKIEISPDLRSAIEDLIRNEGSSNSPVVSSKSENSAFKLDEIEKAKIIDEIVKKGFRRMHAEESLQYKSDLKSCLDWLCLMVPEDDLPASFISRPTNSVSLGQSSTRLLHRDRAVRYMIKSGFNMDTCQSAYDSHHDSELDALATLVRKLTADFKESNTHSVADAVELKQAWNDEMEAVEAIYGSDMIFKNERNHMIQIKVDFSASESVITDAVELHVGVSDRSKYPYELPAWMIVCPSIPAYIRLALLRALSLEACKWIGGPMVFEAVSWIQENFSSLVENPGVTLTQLKTVLTATSGRDASSTPTHMKAAATYSPKSPSAKKKLTKPAETEVELEMKGRDLKAKYEEKVATSEYKAMLRSRQNLPSYKFREEIIQSIDANSVVIICGETGCGKSTQTGQFILEHLLSTGRGGKCNMICTQPRRISAMALAERVAAERTEAVGDTIGYSIRGESVRSPNTRLIFATTGILLRMLQGDPTLNRVTHVIVDEVHERSVDSDFLLVILRELVARRPDFRLILMSATIDSETFSSYFNGAPVLQIPGFTHSVTDVYLEDILKMTKFVPEPRRARPQQSKVDAQKDDQRESPKPATKESVVDSLRESYEQLGLEPRALNWLLKESTNDAVDYLLVAACVRHICETAKDDGAVLIFLQGAMEIKRCIETIQNDIGSLFNLELLPLHAQLSPKEQNAVFKRPRKGFRKVVVSTNVAETSITIDDCAFVIDAGHVKEMRYENSTLCLVDMLASRASCKQRRGRAGRVRQGTCYKLFSRHLEANHMISHAVPEILRVPLEQLCLSLKAMGVDDVEAFLNKAISPPSSKNIEAAVSVLRELHAIDRDTAKLTPLGRHMATIPADLRLSKMLIFGSIFHCIYPILTVAAILSSKSPFVAPFDKRDEAKKARIAFMWDKSDLMTDCRAYDAWVEACKKGKRTEMDFCQQNFLSSTALVAISDLRRQYLDILVDIGFVKGDEVKAALTGSGACNAYSRDGRVVKAAIVSGLYPQVATIKMPEVTYVDTAHGAVEREPAAHDIEISTEQDGRISLHPSSVLIDVGRYEDLLLAFHQKVSTSKVFLRDGTMVSPWPVLMFGGPLIVDHEGRTVAVDGYTKFQAFPRIAVLVDGLRRNLDKVLERKIKEPSLDVLSGSAVGPVLLRLFTEEWFKR